MNEHMTYPWFIWRGRDSRALGVALAGVPCRQAPARRLKRVTVPGRSGTLTVAQTPAWDAFPLEAEILVQPEWPVRPVLEWLRGRGELIFEDEPDRALTAEVTGTLRLAALPGGWHSGKIQFNAQPLKGQYPPEPDIVLTAAGSVYNPGDVHARPLITLTGSGLLQLNVNYDESDDDTKGSQITVDLTDTELTGAIIDTDSMVITDPDGTENLCHLSAIYGNGPEGLWLPAGASAISWDTETVTGVTIRPRWRWL